jgi:hypothetical protein
MDVGERSSRAGGLVTLGVPQNRRRKVVTLSKYDTEILKLLTNFKHSRLIK